MQAKKLFEIGGADNPLYIEAIRTLKYTER